MKESSGLDAVDCKALLARATISSCWPKVFTVGCTMVSGGVRRRTAGAEGAINSKQLINSRVTCHWNQTSWATNDLSTGAISEIFHNFFNKSCWLTTVCHHRYRWTKSRVYLCWRRANRMVVLDLPQHKNKHLVTKSEKRTHYLVSTGSQNHDIKI